MRVSVRKSVSAALVAATVGAFLAASAGPAAAEWRDHDGWGGPAAAGLIGGLALGALAAGAAQPAYGPPVVYDAPPPCWMERRPLFDPYGNIVGYRRYRVCR